MTAWTRDELDKIAEEELQIASVWRELIIATHPGFRRRVYPDIHDTARLVDCIR